MSVSKLARPSPYVVGLRPVIDKDVLPFLMEELRRIEQSIRDVAGLVPQETDREPTNPRPGMIRLSRAPWRPLGGTVDRLVIWEGTAWQAV